MVWCGPGTRRWGITSSTSPCRSTAGSWQRTRSSPTTYGPAAGAGSRSRPPPPARERRSRCSGRSSSTWRCCWCLTGPPTGWSGRRRSRPHATPCVGTPAGWARPGSTAARGRQPIRPVPPGRGLVNLIRHVSRTRAEQVAVEYTARETRTRLEVRRTGPPRGRGQAVPCRHRLGRQSDLLIQQRGRPGHARRHFCSPQQYYRFDAWTDAQWSAWSAWRWNTSG